MVRKLWKLGFAVVRAPASGAKVKRSVYPDITAIYKGKVLVFEVKTRSKPQTIYVDAKQIKKINEFSKRAEGKAFVAIKFIGYSDWRFVPVETLEKTEGNNYKITLENIEKAFTIKDLLKLVNYKGLAKYLH